LIHAAQQALQRAYAPYSGFHVGAAICTESGGIYAGCNVENAAYPLGCCAEASAISAMVMAGHRSIAAVAVAGIGQVLTTPCGGCRQRLREFASDDTPILICDESGLRLATTLGELLPHSFGPDNLKGSSTAGATAPAD
jgi:cytidine deaminase